MPIFETSGVCSSRIEFEIAGNAIKKVRFEDGCDGNLEGISRLIEGMDIKDVIIKLRGIKCQGDTSCPDQLVKALEEYMEAAEVNQAEKMEQPNAV